MDVYQACIQCGSGGTRCEPRLYSSTYTMDISRSTTGHSALGLYVPELPSPGSEPIGSDPALFDDRGFDISSRARRRPRLRDSHPADASVSIVRCRDYFGQKRFIAAIRVGGALSFVYYKMESLHPHTRPVPSYPSISGSEGVIVILLAVAAQEYHSRPQLYEQLMCHARSIAGRELLEAPTVDTIQALLLLSLFPDWGASFDQNRSWLDLGLALDLANQLEIEKTASTFDPCSTSPTERNIFRTWEICHNLDAMTSLVFDRPSSLGPMPLGHKRWPKKPNESYEGMVGVLAEPLQILQLHIKQQNINKLLYGADSVRSINLGEIISSPRLLDSKAITMMEEEMTEQKVLCANEEGGPLPFWLHMANMYPAADRSLQDPKFRSNIIDSAISILESYSSMFDNCSNAKYAPGCFFAYGLLAIAAIYKFIDNAGSDVPQNRVTALVERFSSNLRLLPTVTRAETNQGIFIQTLDHIRRSEPHRAGGTSEPAQEPIVPMLTTVFPGWWRLYL
ncbi:unnamed protein product [Rhizoctonia solani]|uniref:Transcription factor domain-containing protein n=1 Tax=Rhizoctonia solani TaxID=456999 RepID=A0A8H2X004_9AGAM|nr:unnamed protein product [Rhizoctonia solani]